MFGFDVCQTDFGQTGFSPVCPRLAVCQKTVLRASVSARDRSTENSYCRSLEKRVSKGPERSPLQPNWELGGGREDTISGLNVLDASASGRKEVGEMRQLRLRAVGVAVGLGLSAGALFFGPVEAAASTWSIVPSPNSGTSDNQLKGVACVSSSSCTAVGSYRNGSNLDQTLIESWNGTSWSIVPSPNSGTSDNQLNGVACVSASFCTAVGSYISGEAAQTLIESWNGTSWSIVPSPNSGFSFLNGVACVSSSSCTAVGTSYINTSDTFLSLIESWDGTSWSIVASPNTGTSDFLNGVACVSSGFCTAVGNYFSSDFPPGTLVEAWNGSNWSIVSSPNTGTGDFLSGVACVSSESCTAVGTLIESLNGVRWSIVPSPNSGYSFLNGVACISFKSLKSCTAVGGHVGGQTLIESKKANKWLIVASPNTGTDDFLTGVACVSSGFCTAVGHYYNNSSGVYQTLIESA